MNKMQNDKIVIGYNTFKHKTINVTVKYRFLKNILI